MRKSFKVAMSHKSADTRIFITHHLPGFVATFVSYRRFSPDGVSVCVFKDQLLLLSSPLLLLTSPL